MEKKKAAKKQSASRKASMSKANPLESELGSDLGTGMGSVIRDPVLGDVPSDRFDGLIRTLVDGSELDRLLAVQRVPTLAQSEREELGARLHLELTEGIAAEASITARRDPDRIPSIRSWMFSALTRCGASDRTRQLVADELLSGEGVANGFWILAGVFATDPEFAGELARRLKPDQWHESVSDTEMLASVIAPGDRGWVREALVSMLAPGKFEIAWPALRALRIVPWPEMVEPLTRLFLRPGEPDNFTFDSLYALCAIPQAAVEHLQKDPGIEEAIRRIFDLMRVSDPVALYNFSGLIVVFPPADVERVIADLERDHRYTEIARAVRGNLRYLRTSDGPRARMIAGFSSDAIDISHDFLDFDRDVQTIAAVMVADKVPLPLAIGLFGDWGAGKSHFMASLEAAVNTLRDRAIASDSRVFSHEVVQIRFNAWHYVDTSLWASLVSKILEDLAAHVDPQESPEVQQSRLIKELASAQEVVKAAEAAKEARDRDRDEKAEALRVLLAEREQKRVSLRELSGRDITRLLMEDPGAKAALDKALGDIGVTAVIGSVDDLNDAVSEARKTAFEGGSIVREIAESRSAFVLVVLLVFALVLVPLVPAILESLGMNAVAVELSGWLTGAAAIIAAGARGVQTAVKSIRGKLQAIQDAKARVEKVLADKRSEATKSEQQLAAEIRKLDIETQQAEADLTAASERVNRLEQQIQAINEERSLARFLSDRAGTDEYRKHLGLISTIRSDFESLTKRLARQPGHGQRRVDRIVLYIDDLDRCPHDKVMDVLQAVHLLLAFKLFVVVVGVDPRWLSRALKATYPQLESPDGESTQADTQGSATTEDYLEKIFQIQYCLPRISRAGFERMLGHEMGVAIDAPIGQSSASGSGPGGRGAGGSVSGAGGPGTQAKDARGRPDGSKAQKPRSQSGRSSGGTVLKVAAEPFKVAPESLVISHAEVEFGAFLAPLFATPRSVKRFSNMYRVLKASVSADELRTYEGGPAGAGDFVVPMVLLAMLIADPRACALAFPRLRAAAREGGDTREDLINTAEEILSALEEGPAVATIGESGRRLLERMRGADFPNEAELIERWVPRVARFSFAVGSLPGLAPASSPSTPDT